MRCITEISTFVFRVMPSAIGMAYKEWNRKTFNKIKDARKHVESPNNKCKKAHRKHEYISPNFIAHIPHSDELRIANQKLVMGEIGIQLMRHRYSLSPPWNQKRKMKKFDIQKINNNNFECKIKK